MGANAADVVRLAFARRFCFTDCNNLSCWSWSRDRNIHVRMSIKGCVWQTLKDVIGAVSRASGTVISADNTARYASCKLGLISDYPRGGVCDI